MKNSAEFVIIRVVLFSKKYSCMCWKTTWI